MLNMTHVTGARLRSRALNIGAVVWRVCVVATWPLKRLYFVSKRIISTQLHRCTGAPKRAYCTPPMNAHKSRIGAEIRGAAFSHYDFCVA